MSPWLPEGTEADLASVIVPCYNRASLVEQTLDSVWSQSYRPIELIVVDDGSSDRSREVVEGWIDQHKDKGDPTFAMKSLHKSNGGPSEARNAGLLESRGAFLQFVDSDDILHPNKLGLQISAIRDSHAGFSVCNYQAFTSSIDDGGEILDFYHRSHLVEDFPTGYPMHTATVLFARETINAGGPWKANLRAAEDFEFNFRMMCTGAKGIWLDQVLAYVRKHGSSERIQATPLRDRYRWMYQGLVEMELQALDAGRCTPRLLRSLGVRALSYCRHLRAEGSRDQALAFWRYARARVPAWQRAFIAFRHRFWRPTWRRMSGIRSKTSARSGLGSP
jgi:glycosyltransferase involved in cell wall biosynthesis